MAVMEVTRLKVADPAGLVKSRRAMLDDFRQRPGFVSAELVRLSSDEWLDLIIWTTSDDFAASRRRGADTESVSAYFAAIDEVISSREGQVWEA